MVLYKIDAVVKNEGCLPSCGSFLAQRDKITDSVKVKLDLPETEQCGTVLVGGELEQDLGHLGGRAGGGSYKKRASWVVKGAEGSSITVTAFCPRAGKIKQKLILNQTGD